MEQPIFTTSDILYFLSQHDQGLWTRNMHDPKTMKTRTAKVEDFDNLKVVTLEMLVDDEKEWKMYSLSNFNFGEISASPTRNANGVMTRIKTNFSMSWCACLLETYGAEYAEMLSAWCEKNLNLYERSKSSMSESEQLSLKRIMERYERLKAMADAVIAQDDKTSGVTA